MKLGIKNLKEKLNKKMHPAWVWVLAITMGMFSFISYNVLFEPSFIPAPIMDFSKKVVETILGDKDINIADNNQNNSGSSGSNNSNQISNIDTSNWQTYENKELGFSIKYPNDWYYRFYDNNFIGFAPNTMSEDNIVGIQIVENSTVEKEVEKQIEIISNNGNREFISISSFNFNNITGKDVKDKNKTSNLVGSTYIFSVIDRVYILNGDINYKNAEDIINTFTAL